MHEITTAITPAIKAAADLYEKAGKFSIENPTTGAGDNPHWKPADRAHRAATGSVNLLWICGGCRRILPRVTALLKTACCGRGEVQVQRHGESLTLDLVRFGDETTEQAATDLIGALPITFENLGDRGSGGWDAVRFSGSPKALATLLADYQG